MDCYICGYHTKVVNSRLQSKLNQIWRRRFCNNCKYIFTTIEKIDLERSMSVRAKNGNISPFIREKLLISVNNSLGHRNNHINDAVAITETIISKLLTKYKNSIIDLDKIILATEEVLKRFDNTAAIHYAAYHQN